MVANRWPKEMPVLKPSDFEHGSWASPRTKKDLDALDGVGKGTCSITPQELERIGCGTRCCLVGHVRHAFGLPAWPGAGGPPPPQAEKFLRRLCENLGRPIEGVLQSMEFETCTIVESLASDAFEGVYFNGAYRPPVTTRQAAKAWAKTLEDFGYTEDA